MPNSNTDNATTMELYLERTLYACRGLLARIYLGLSLAILPP